MTTRNRLMLTGGMLILALTMAGAQTAPRPSGRPTTAETGLVGIRLFDTGARVIRLFGSPLEILGLTQGGGGTAGGGGGGGGTGGARGRGPQGGGEGGGAATRGDFDPNASLVGDPFGLGDTPWRQLTPASDGQVNPGAEGDGGGRSAGRGGAEGGGNGAGPAGDGTGERVIFTRWAYKRPNANYAFIFDKFNRVVQIEALGLRDSRVRTRKGVTFGATFGELIRKYGAPDAYEISGDNIVVRFLVKDRVAFRLSRTVPRQPHRVTGIVVAAGKS